MEGQTTCTMGAYRILCVSIFMLLVKIVGAAVELELSTTTLVASGDPVTVSWTNLESPTTFDWLGIYMPPESSDDHYIGYIFLSSVSGWETGKGSYTLPAVNMRAPYQFRLFRGYPPTQDTALDEDSMPIPSIKTPLAVSHAVNFTNYNEPTQVRLSLTSNPTEMTVMFVTKDPVKTNVKFGKDSNDLRHFVTARAHTYEQKDMCDAPANTSLGWRDPGYIHVATMSKLDPGERYFYQVGSPATGWSQTFAFVSAHTTPSSTHALLFGDMGTYAPYRTFNWLQRESLNTMQHLLHDLNSLQPHPALISHIGDISYARGYSWLWEQFFHQVQPVASRAPWHVCIGNHEYDYPAQPWKPEWSPYGKDSGGECGVPYSLRFTMPPAPSSFPIQHHSNAPELNNLYHSLDFGVVHFVWISTETNFLPGSDQYNWITQDLKSVDRERTPFIVFQGHRPMYSTDNKAMRVVLTRKLIEHLEPLLVEHRVSLALWGHVHKYERTCALQNFTCMEGKEGAYPVHMVIGMGGQDWQPVDQPRLERPLAPIFPQPVWSLFRSFEFGYVRLHATKSVMRVSYVGNHDGQVHDVVEFRSPVVENQSGKERLEEHVSLANGQGATWGSVARSEVVFGVFPVVVAFMLGAVLTGVTATLFARKPRVG